MRSTYIYRRITLLILLCFCCALGASAQKLFTVTGVVFRKSTQDRVAKAIIQNITRKTVANSDDLGTFRIQAAAGDSLLIKKVDFTNQTIAIVNDDLLSIYLQPIVVLNEVKINEASKREELADALNDYKKNGQFYTTRPSVGSVITSPISGLYSLFGKSAANARRFQQYSEDELEHQEIRRRYNKPLIKKTTGMPDEDLDQFILTFSPTIENIKVWSDYDIINYIKRSYEYFKVNKATMKSQKLKVD